MFEASYYDYGDMQEDVDEVMVQPDDESVESMITFFFSLFSVLKVLGYN